MKLSLSFRTASAFLSFAFAAALLTGCSSKFDPMEGTTPPQTAVGPMTGRVFGGRTPIVGAAVYLYQNGATGYGSASTSILGNNSGGTGYPTGTGSGGYPTSIDGNGNYYVTTDSNGFFGLSGEYTCTSGYQVYAYAVGGDGDANNTTATNSAIGLLAALGQCPASGNLASTVPYINMNEASTIAAAYALAGFATSATSIGIPTSGTSALATLEQTNLNNAFLTAASIFPMSTPNPTGSFPTTTAATGSSGTLPTAKLNALANSLAACINSDTPTSTPCTDVLEGGTTDTASAAIYIAQHPLLNVGTIFGAAAGTALPYNNALSSVPNDWTLSIIYTGGGLTTSVSSTSTLDLAGHALAVDASGNIWEASGANGTSVISGFSNLGVPLASSGFTNSCLSGPSSVALDAASANIVIANFSSGTAGTLCEYNIAGKTWTTIKPTHSGTSYLSSPNDAAFDASGNIWVANEGNSEMTKLTSAGAYTAQDKWENTSVKPSSIAIEPTTTGLIWSGSAAYCDAFSYTSADAYNTFADLEVGSTCYSGSAIALDASGNVWTAMEEASLGKYTKTGTTIAQYNTPIPYSSYTDAYVSLAVDGASNVWLPDFYQGFIYEYSDAGTVLSGSYGFLPGQLSTTGTFTPGSAPPTGYIQPYNIAIDGSGNVWFSVLGNASLEEMVGAAVPVVTPISYGVANSLLGQEP